jgi:hypothetical protein
MEEEKFTKKEFTDRVEMSVCKWCRNYNHGEFSTPCRLCNISVVYQTIDLMEHK